MTEHEELLKLAAEFARQRCFDEAHRLALRVAREDGRNTEALWITAFVTSSLNERRNALRTLLRLQPENVLARRMLGDTNQELKADQPSQLNPPTSTSSVIRSIKPDAVP